MKDTEAREDEIRKRLEAATPGPWFHFDRADMNAVGCSGDPDAIVHWVGFDSATGERVAENARLIANAPADLRYLLEKCERLEAAIRKHHKGVLAQEAQKADRELMQALRESADAS